MKNYNEYLILDKPDVRDRVRNWITAIGLIVKIRKRPFITRKQFAEVIGITAGDIQKQLDKLKKARRICCLETIIKGHWKIIRNKVIKTWQHLDR